MESQAASGNTGSARALQTTETTAPTRLQTRGEHGVGNPVTNVRYPGSECHLNALAEVAVHQDPLCLPHLVSPIASVECQVHSRCLIHVYWTKLQTQNRGRICPLKCRGTARKDCATSVGRTLAPGYISLSEAREMTLKQPLGVVGTTQGEETQSSFNGVSISYRGSQPSPASSKLLQED